MDTIPCTNPHHGVRNHLIGTDAAKACAASGGRAPRAVLADPEAIFRGHVRAGERVTFQMNFRGEVAELAATEEGQERIRAFNPDASFRFVRGGAVWTSDPVPSGTGAMNVHEINEMLTEYLGFEEVEPGELIQLGSEPRIVPAEQPLTDEQRSNFVALYAAEPEVQTFLSTHLGPELAARTVEEPELAARAATLLGHHREALSMHAQRELADAHIVAPFRNPLPPLPRLQG